jgi:hypothetical protein
VNLRPLAFAALAVVGVVAAGCNSPTTEVRLRDPSEVALEIDTPSGPQVVLPKSRTPAEVELPRTEPPYLGEALFEAHPIRTARGGIELRCDACVGYPLVKPIGDDGTIHYDGLPEDRLDWSSTSLRMTYTHPFCHPGRYCGQGGAYRVRFVTDMQNVEQIRHVEHGPSPFYMVPIALVLDGVVVASAYGLATAAVGKTAWALGLVGVSLFSWVALPITVLAIASVVSPPREEIVYPR